MNELSRSDVIHILRLCGWSLQQIADYLDMDRRRVVAIVQRRFNPLHARLTERLRRRRKNESKAAERQETIPT